MSYLIISTIVLIVAVMSVLNGVGLRRQGKRDEGTAWMLAAALAVVVVLVVTGLAGRPSPTASASARLDQRKEGADR